MAAFRIDFTNERIIPYTGLSIVRALLGHSGFKQRVDAADITGKRSGHQIKDGDIFTSFIALGCMGRPDFTAIHEMDDDPEFYRASLGIDRIPSEESLWQRMDETGSSKRQLLIKENAKLLLANGCLPSQMPEGFVPLDMDMTPQDNSKTKKEGVSRTYKGFDGMAPMMAYIGSQGYMINCELCEGKQHCQNHTPEFLREALLPQGVPFLCGFPRILCNGMTPKNASCQGRQWERPYLLYLNIKKIGYFQGTRC